MPLSIAAVAIVRRSKSKLLDLFRRTYASILDENGVPTALRKKLMGHSLTPMEKSYLVDGFSAKEIVIIMTGVYSKVLNNKVLAA